MIYQKITIPLDHGNRNMKTAEEVFTSGLVESDLKPVLGEYLEYNGKYYGALFEKFGHQWIHFRLSGASGGQTGSVSMRFP